MRSFISFSFIPAFIALTLATSGCSSDAKTDAKTDAKADAKAEDKGPSLMLSNDTPVCRKALECCEEMVKLDKGEAKPEDINLSCSGVGLAADDKLCSEFKAGYAMAIESQGKGVPESCK